MSRLVYHTRSPGAWRRTSSRRRSPSFSRRPRRSRIVVVLAWLFRMLRGKRILRRLIVLGLAVFLIGAVFLTFAVAAISRGLPEPGKLLTRTIPISTKIYDREGKVLLYDIHGEAKRTPIALDKIAPHAKWAAIVAEDKQFYSHKGFNLRGIARAMMVNVLRLGKVQGGSSITQQFIKNAVLTREKTLTRKLKELVLAYRIEQKFSKDEILNMYFNEIPYGSTTYGIEAAAQTFFGKSASKLDLVEAATLAALPKAPTRLSPYGNHTDELVGRVRHLLNEMAEAGYIKREEAEAAKKEDPLKRVRPRQEKILAPHFVLYVRELLVDRYGEEFVERGGLKVITTLDWRVQQIAEEEVRQGAQRNEKTYGGKNAALVAQDPKNGEILAMVGSRDYFDETIDGNVNVALRARQPGSSFKPVVYAAAFEKGFTPETLLYDVVTTFKVQPKDYAPKNYDGREHGLVSIRQALAGSLNVPAVKTIYLTGIDRVLDLAQKLGYTTFGERSRFGLSIVLGGGEVKLLEHTGAFATLANDGRRLPQKVILRVEDTSGRLLEETPKDRGEQIIDQTIAREVTSILSDNAARAFIFGAENTLILKGRPVAAKTGTTNDFRDGWTLGYTPSLAAGVWVGNNDNTALRGKADGSNIAAPIWNAFLRRALEGKPVEQFPFPEPRPVANPILRGQGMGAATARVDKISGKLATTLTPAELIEERTYQTLHSELYYINKNDLSAPPPTNPAEDPNFETWEGAVRQWAEINGIRAEAAPAEYDDLHIESNRPVISFITPSSGATITGSDLRVELFASAPRGISRIDLSIDGALKGDIRSAPYVGVLSIAGLSDGTHTLTATAYDDVLNRAESSVQITVMK